MIFFILQHFMKWTVVAVTAVALRRVKTRPVVWNLRVATFAMMLEGVVIARIYTLLRADRIRMDGGHPDCTLGIRDIWSGAFEFIWLQNRTCEGLRSPPIATELTLTLGLHLLSVLISSLCVASFAYFVAKTLASRSREYGEDSYE